MGENDDDRIEAGPAAPPRGSDWRAAEGRRHQDAAGQDAAGIDAHAAAIGADDGDPAATADDLRRDTAEAAQRDEAARVRQRAAPPVPRPLLRTAPRGGDAA